MNKILVLGDICVDVNYYGEVRKISPEAPIPIFTVLSKEEIPGMSGNVIKNLENAGNEVISYTKDNFEYPMTKKNRYYAGKHYLYRIDEDNIENLTETEESLILRFLSGIKDLKAVVLQDYNKGFFTEGFITDIISTIREFHPNAIIIADGHKSRNLFFYSGVDYLKVNEEEFKQICEPQEYYLDFVVRGIVKTMGERGAALLKRSSKHSVQEKVDNVIDVTGAGDTFVSWFISELAKGTPEYKAVDIACYAAGISVQHLGCYAPSIEEVERGLRIEYGVYG